MGFAFLPEWSKCLTEEILILKVSLKQVVVGTLLQVLDRGKSNFQTFIETSLGGWVALWWNEVDGELSDEQEWDLSWVMNKNGSQDLSRHTPPVMKGSMSEESSLEKKSDFMGIFP